MNRALSNNLITVPNGLVGHWPMDAADIAGTVLTERCGNGLNASLGGTAPTIIPGKVGQGLSFGSSSNTTVGYTQLLDLTYKASFAMWINPDPSWPAYAVFLDKYSTNSGNTCWRVSRSSSTTMVSFYDYTHVIAGGSLTISAWNHIVVTIDTGVCIIYVNGINVASGAVFSPLQTYSGVTYIGRYVSGANFVGKLDDMRIYNRTLSQAEIIQIYIAGLSGHQ